MHGQLSIISTIHISVHILHLDSRRRWVVRFTLWPHFLQIKFLRYLLNKQSFPIIDMPRLYIYIYIYMLQDLCKCCYMPIIQRLKINE